MSDYITLAHGSGGKAYKELIESVFLPAYSNEYLDRLTDSAICSGAEKLAFTTDSYCVSPLFFPGGDIGRLSICGTVNDLSTSGAIPKYISIGMIIEAGFSISMLKNICASIASTAKEANVKIVTGDTKVVEKGNADGIYINTAGIGLFDSVPISQIIEVGDVIISSGQIGNHGIAIMSARDDLEFTPPIKSDVAPLNFLVQAAMRVCPEIHAMRDPTRGGVAQTLCEWTTKDIDIAVHDEKIPKNNAVSVACDLLGLDLMHIANEGVMLFAVKKKYSGLVVNALRKEKYGETACEIGEVVRGSGNAYAVTKLGSKRIIRMPVGELLPRIC